MPNILAVIFGGIVFLIGIPLVIYGTSLFTTVPVPLSSQLIGTDFYDYGHSIGVILIIGGIVMMGIGIRGKRSIVG